MPEEMSIGVMKRFNAIQTAQPSTFLAIRDPPTVIIRKEATHDVYYMNLQRAEG